MKKSWKTTVAGIGAILAALGPALSATFDGNPQTNADWSAVIAAIVAGVGLIFARDNNVTSEEALGKK